MISPLRLDFSWKRIHFPRDSRWCPLGGAFQRERWQGFAAPRVTWRTVWTCLKAHPLSDGKGRGDRCWAGRRAGAQNPGLFLTVAQP